MSTRPPAQAPASASAWLKSLAQQVAPYRRGAIAAGSAAGLFTVVQMAALAYIIDRAVISDSTATDLLPWFIALLLALALKATAQGIQTHFMARASLSARNEARSQLTNAWKTAGPVRLLDESAGTLAREWIDHVEALHGYFARYLPQMSLAVFVPLLVLAVVVWLDWLAAVFLFLAAPLIPIFMALVGMGAESLNQRHFEAIGRLSGQFLDKVRGLTTLQLFGQTEPAAQLLQTRSDDYRRLTMKTLRVAFLSSAVLEFFASVSIAVVAMYVGFGLLGYIEFGPAPQLTLFSGLFLLLLAPEFFQPLRQLAQHYHDRAAALGAAQLIVVRLDDLKNTRDQPKDAGFSPITQPPACTRNIMLERVSVRFPDGRTGLSNCSLVIGQGESLALTGPSGGGKSTLLHVLAGFIKPTEGSVAVFCEPPGTEPFAWMAQSPYTVHGTWAEHLRLTAPGASERAMVRALEAAGLGELLRSRPQGLHSHVTEAGSGLSGGQARRLSLARVLLSDARLILLDEPTAGLDGETEQIVLAALQKLTGEGRTLVFATHHRSLLGLADRVLTVQAGEVSHS